jgi:hypothetical protein
VKFFSLFDARFLKKWIYIVRFMSKNGLGMAANTKKL